GKNRSTYSLDKFVHLLIVAVASHEHKARAQMRAHAFNRAVEHVTRQGGHHHVAKNDFKVIGEHLMDAFDAVAHGHDFVAFLGQEILHDLLKGRVVFDQKDAFGKIDV